MQFSQLAILLVVAASFGLVAKTLRQPLLIGYIFAGIFLAATGLIKESSALTSFGQIGVTLLLFLLGLEMNIGEISTFSRVAILGGLAQISFTFLLGFLLISLLGFGALPAFCVALALTFSSTIIVVKLLSEKKDLASLYGRISIGIALVQDFVIIAILMFLSGFGKTGVSMGEYILVTLKAGVLFGSVWFFSKKILPFAFDKFLATSHELLYVVSIAWALGVAAFVAGPLGFTLEIGGLLAGLSLSQVSEHLQIAGKTRPLRDFFLLSFFVLLGTKLVVGRDFWALLPTATLLSLFVLLVKPLTIMIALGLMGYKRKTSFLSAVTLSHTSEFSLILAGTAFSLGLIEQKNVSLIVMVAVISMSVSTYLILRVDAIYRKVGKHLGLFERKHTQEEAYAVKSEVVDHVVLVGCDRTGRTISTYLVRENIPFVVIDFNPKVFNRLTVAKIPVVFGDVNDPETVDASNLDKAKMLISTILNLEDNLTLLEHLKTLRVRPVTLFTASNRAEAIRLYEAGASYVIVPEMVAGEHIRHILETYGMGSQIEKIGKSHFNRLMFK